MQIANKNIVVAGLGMSGFAAACFLKKRGASVVVADSGEEDKLKSYASVLREMGVKIELGQHRIDTFEKADFIVVSPGVPHNILPIRNAALKGIPVLGEIELAYRFIKEPVVAVTGTNGKTTTTTILGEMLKASGKKIFVGGNIGNPLIDYADKGQSAEIIVAELSSFQLDTITEFRPKVGVLLNITEDHLDRYPDFSAYVGSKARIFENQMHGDFAVFNGHDPLAASICKNIKSRKLPFYNTIKDDLAISTSFKSLDFSRINLAGKHNLENVYAASLAALAIGGTLKGIQSALNSFKGLPHRLEHVASINGIDFFNDSKATNVDAVARALETFNRPVILIMGGRDKEGRFETLKDLVSRHVKKLIVMGEAKEAISSVLGDIASTEEVFSMKDAVMSAYKAASGKEVVLLSPACASFDMYDSYVHRGEDFCRIVGNLCKSELK